ncbi:receptor-like protein kinase [Olea europaea var. sylvestris]|uniref:receptor-like protein kinase n=1 Tax=Olea europaea var. sylvestris TaxID=158386 RepID=UPI000C1D4121|nr:receptor-like protein kinase [Olea europaea var. sylvestris]
MGKNVIFTLLAILYLLINVVASLNNSTDHYALLSIKSQITFDPNKILGKNWSQGISFCSWIGITCGKRYQGVRGLNLANMGRGDEIGNLSQLQELEMQGNELNGPVPASLGFLGNLQKLNLSENRLYGEVPNSIFNLSSLTEISLRGSSLSGSLPMDICYNLPKLESLRISNNQMSGNIPPSLGRCMNLKLLSLSSNNFSGTIPMEIGNLSKLQILYLHRNNLIDTSSLSLDFLIYLLQPNLLSTTTSWSLANCITEWNNHPFLCLCNNIKDEPCVLEYFD